MSNGVAQAVNLFKQENTRLRERIEWLEAENRALQSYIQGISALHEATLSIVTHSDVLDLLDETLYQALVILNTDSGSLILVDEDTEELVFVLVHGSLRQTLEGYRLPQHQGIAGWVVEHRKPVIVNDTRADKRFSDAVDMAFGVQSRKLIAVPMLANNRVIGVLELVNKRDGSNFSDSDATLLSLLALYAGMSLNQLEQQLALEETSG